MVDIQRVEPAKYRFHRGDVHIRGEKHQRIHRRSKIDPNPVVERGDPVVDLDHPALLCRGQERNAQLPGNLDVLVPLGFLLVPGSRIAGVVLKKAHRLQVLARVAIVHRLDESGGAREGKPSARQSGRRGPRSRRGSCRQSVCGLKYEHRLNSDCGEQNA